MLVLTTFDLDEYVFGALRAGAAGFLLKDAPRPARRGDPSRARGRRTPVALDTCRLVEDYAARTDPVEPPEALLDALTPREREVLVLVARGLSNADIGQRLVVTDATVKSHVGSILVKFGLRDRVQAVVFAYEHGIVVPGGFGSRTGPDQVD